MSFKQNLLKNQKDLNLLDARANSFIFSSQEQG